MAIALYSDYTSAPSILSVKMVEGCTVASALESRSRCDCVPFKLLPSANLRYCNPAAAFTVPSGFR
jgi:hypothetical protein